MSGNGSESSSENVQPKKSSSAGQIRAVIWLTLIVVAVLGGMFTGVFTVIESSAVAALIAMVMVIVERTLRRDSGLPSKLWSAGKGAVGVTAMVFSMIIGAHLLTQFLVMARIPNQFATWVGSLDVAPWVIVALFLALLIPLGMFLESMSIILVVVPLMAPIVTNLGFDPIWFGILFVIMLELGLVTPPVGMNVFVTSTTSGISLESVFRGVTPFVLVILLSVAIMFLVPELITWLPSLLN